MSDDYKLREKQAEKVVRLANCYYFDDISCEKCLDKFICHTKRLHCYQITEYYSGFTIYRVFAESEEQAEKYFNDFIGNEAIIEEYQSKDSVNSIEIEVVKLTPQRKWLKKQRKKN